MGWQEAWERQKLRGKVEQLGGSDDVYRENCLYEHFMREYQKRPDTKYYGEFGAGHVLMSDYSGKIYRVQNSLVARLAEEGSPLNGKQTVIDGGLTFEIGNLGESDTNHIILYNTARAKNAAAESGKFFAASPDIPDEKIAQYAILFEHPDQITSSEEHPGWYSLSHKKE